MKRTPKRRRRTWARGAASLTELFGRDGAMRALVALAGILVGVMATHLDLGRRVDGLTVQLQAMTARLESVERTMIKEK